MPSVEALTPPASSEGETGVVVELGSYVAGFEEWLADQGRSRKTILMYRQKSRHFAAWVGGRPLTLRLLHEYRAYLQREKPKPWREDLGCRPRTVRSSFTALRTFWVYLKEQGMGELPDIRAVPMPRLDAAKREVPTDDEVRRLFAAAHKIGQETADPAFATFLRARALAVLSLAAGCGLRRAEMLALNLSDLRRDKQPWEVNVRCGKGAQSRWIPVGEAEQAFLSQWLRSREARCAKRGYVLTALLLDDKGHRMGNRSAETLMRALSRVAGLEDRHLTLHGFRHHFGTVVLEEKGIKTAQALLGHASSATTLDIYGHTDPEKMRDAVDRASRRIHTPNGGAEKESPGESASKPQARGERRLRRKARRDV